MKNQIIVQIHAWLKENEKKSVYLGNLLSAGLIFFSKKILAITFRDLLILSWLGFLGIILN